jgi:ABC-type multidrug transport system fused ATPase/permease subunit
MHAIQQLLPYIKRYPREVVLNIVCNVTMVFFNLVSIPMLIPFLQILLGQEIPPTQKPVFELSATGLKTWFYYQLGHIIEVFGKEQALIYVCVGMVVVFFFKNLFRYLAQYVIIPLRNGVIRDLRAEVFEKTLRVPLGYFSEERKGDLISRVSADVMEVEWGILSFVETIVREPLMLVGSIALMVFISPSLTLFVFVLLIFTGLIIGSIGKNLKRESAQVQESLGSLVSVLDEALGGARVVRGFNAENYQREKFGKENDLFRRLQTKALRRRDLASPTTEFLGVTVVCVLIWFGFKQVSENGLSPASFLAFLYAFFTVIDPAKAFTTASYNIRKAAGALERIQEILRVEETIGDPAVPQPLAVFHEDIEYRNVAFRYRNDADDWILKNINLTIPKGKIVALVGASGAGKSTLADLLPRFYDVTEGGIFLDGMDIRQYKLKDLRAQMGIVTQEALLFNDTIYNNIVFGLENARESDVIAAAKAANAYDFIENTEGGMHTNIGDRGMKLSGGQRQRLTIARALLRNPEILILDEATSALDSESEKLVQDALGRLMKGRTAIVIAHRLSTIQHADVIVVMEAGHIIERGTHESLLAKKGAYWKLVELQGLT